MLFPLVLIISSCSDQGNSDYHYDPQPYELNIPENYPPIRIPENNLLTEEGVLLGRHLFYDPIISSNGSYSCSTCHKSNFNFSDNVQFSTGSDGHLKKVNTMPLFNVAFYTRHGWNGKIETIENDVQITISALHGDWSKLISDLSEDTLYQRLFFEAFGAVEIKPEQIEKSISQFVRSLVSFNTRYDSIIAGLADPTLSEMRGFELFFTEEGDCFHCHIDPLFTNLGFHNNALDSLENMDSGFELVTGMNMDKGKFKVPTLRNLAYTAPYMHDGRFNNLKDVIDFYSEGLQFSVYADSNMKNLHKGGIQISKEDKNALISFLNTLNDHSLKNNALLKKP